MNRQRPEIEQLSLLLAAMLGDVHSIVPIDSGTTGTSYRIATETAQYVAKQFRADSHALLGPRAQFELLSQLAQKGIAPRPAGYDEAAGLLVTEFIRDAASLPSTALCTPESLAKIAILLSDLRRISADIPVFAPAAAGDRYIERLGGPGRLSRQDKARSDEFFDLTVNLDTTADCLCHNDLLADNILWDPLPKLIDFDYAVRAAPILDLASLAILNEFSTEAQSGLLAAYADATGIEYSMAEFARVQRLVRLLAHFWSLAAPDAEAAIVAQYRISDV